MSKVRIMSTIMDMLSRGKDIPFALRNSANYYGINIEQVKELLRDVNQKDREANYINSEPGSSYKYGSDWEQIE